ncbi:MAG: hypothetical protein JWO78_2077 [Micavibrio sp.]|nr:hypothetical protein [Micavibrio sp.]
MLEAGIRDLRPQRGDIVELIEKPTGCCSAHYKLTVGKHYQVKEIFGCCVQTDTDDGDTGIFNYQRVKVVFRSPRPHPQ